jgi:hypothetical protein
MTALSLETTVASANPIDLVEEIVQANEWAHDRATDDEMVVEISGRWCDYRLLFIWQRELNALHFSAAFEMKVPRVRRAAVYELLAVVKQIEDLVEISLSECERFFPAFQLVVWGGKSAEEAIAAAMIDPIGEA